MLLQRAEGRPQLGCDPIDPRLVLRCRRTQVAFIHNLRAFFASSQRQRDDFESMPALVFVGRS